MNQKTNAIKWLAILTMTIDHIGFYVFQEVVLFRLIGRLAFPFFLYTTIQGVKTTVDFPKYIFRLLGTAVFSLVILSPIHIYWNILFLLALFALSLKDRRLILPTLFLSFFAEYGMYGFLYGWGIKVMVDYDRLKGLFFILVLHLALYSQSIQLYAAFASFILLLPMKWELPRFPKLLGYIYYPLHQLLLYGIVLFIN